MTTPHRPPDRATIRTVVAVQHLVGDGDDTPIALVTSFYDPDTGDLLATTDHPDDTR